MEKFVVLATLLHMLSVDHSNIDVPPLAVKCVRKFRSALGGEVTSVCVCVCVCVRVRERERERERERKRERERERKNKISQ